jgi:hypothetical protein
LFFDKVNGLLSKVFFVGFKVAELALLFEEFLLFFFELILVEELVVEHFLFLFSLFIYF